MAIWPSGHRLQERLDDTKLFRLADHEFRVSRAGRLVAIHTK